MLNFRVTEIIDFLGGWFLLDLAGDDTGGTNDWPWRTDNPRENETPRPDLPW
ncbi:MAG: hypothetical protein V2A76_11770 [Planctomycetota bacterium]